MSMNLEEIMKPYFDKQKEIKNNYEVRKNSLRLQLEKIRDNKESEIAEYIQNAVLDGRDFYAGYSAMIREDLERAYAQKESELEKEIASVDKYYRVDVKEAIEIKGEIRKELVAAKKELELDLMEAKIEFDTVMFKLKKFNYVYDENHNVLNADEFKELYAESNRLIEVKYGYETELKKLDEYLQMTELTEEEIKIGMMSMTPWEKEEYDRRKVSKMESMDDLKTEDSVNMEKLYQLNEEIENDIENIEIAESDEDEELDNDIIELVEKISEEIVKEKLNSNPDLERRLLEYEQNYPEVTKRAKEILSMGDSFVDRKQYIYDLLKENPELSALFMELLLANTEEKQEEDIFVDEDIPFDLSESVKKAVEEEKEQIEQELFEDEEKEDDFDFDVVEPDELPLEEEKEDITHEVEENLGREIDQIEREIEKEETVEEKIQRDLIDSSIDLEEPKITLDEQDNVIAESYNDLLYYIFADISEAAKKMRSVKIDGSKGELSSNSRYISTSEDAAYEEYEVRGQIQHEEVALPNGEFVNKKDIFKAIDRYRKSNKGRTFTVNGKEYEITRKTARDLKKVLKKCTTITLLNEKKITEFDMKRVIGKNMTEDSSKIDLGKVATDLPTGDYINAHQFLANLRNVFEEKKTSWFKRTWEKMRNRSNENNQQAIEVSEVEELEEENVKVR